MFGAPSGVGRGVPHRPVIPERPESQTGLQIDELLECGCCCEAEFLITDMSTCSEGHLFCKKCIRRYTENEVGDAKTKFKCLNGECAEEFSLPVLQGLLSEALFKKVVQMKQMEEVMAAQIEGFESCPFCEFGSIPDPEDKIFHCQNPDCMKKSCRQCHEMSHIPLRCGEVEKDKEMQARKIIEDRMTKVLVRECWQCKKKFVKLDGCNKMVCTCGAKMCYICRKPVDNYNHFTETNSRGKCPLWSNNDELHVNAVVEEGQRALRDLKTEDPTLNLKHDPTKVLPVPEQPARQGQQGRAFDGNQGRMPNVFINGNPLFMNNGMGPPDHHFNQNMGDFVRGMQQFGANMEMFGERMRAQFAPMQAQAEAVRQQAAIQRQIAAEQRLIAQAGAEEVRRHAQEARLVAEQERIRAQEVRWQAQEVRRQAQEARRQAQEAHRQAQEARHQAHMQAQVEQRWVQANHRQAQANHRWAQANQHQPQANQRQPQQERLYCQQFDQQARLHQLQLAHHLQMQAQNPFFANHN